MGDLKTENTSYPAALDTATLWADNVDEIVAALSNGPNSAIVAIEAELGTGLKGSMTDLVSRLAVNIAADGGLISGADFPVSPPNKPHLFYHTDINEFYIYKTDIASYTQVSTALLLANYLRKDIAATITAVHEFNPATTSAPFTLGANAVDQLVTGLNADQLQGKEPATTATATTIALRDTSGNLTAASFIGSLTGTADNAINVTTNINGHAITDIFESDGITAKAATVVVGNSIAFTSATSTSWTVPNNVAWVFVDIQGGGGGGGGGQGGNGIDAGVPGGGGGQGATILRYVYPVTPSESISIVVGAGGTGGSAGISPGGAGGNGTDGGDSSFGNVVIKGGVKGIGGPTNIGGPGGGAAGCLHTYLTRTRSANAWSGIAGNAGSGTTGGVGGGTALASGSGGAGGDGGGVDGTGFAGENGVVGYVIIYYK